jgi:C4-dicarboxylate-specific signal transduction histidine kinase
MGDPGHPGFAPAARSRSLDRDDVERELARHVPRMAMCTGGVVAHRPRVTGGAAGPRGAASGGQQDRRRARGVRRRHRRVRQRGRGFPQHAEHGQVGAVLAIIRDVSEATRAARIVGKLLTFARQNPPEKMRTELNQVLQDTIELRRYPLKMQQIALVVEFAESLPATWADPFQLQQVFINILSNVEQVLASRSGERRITVRTELRDRFLVATIADTGPGIAPEHLPHIFNPFYTTKPRGVGTGLGLSISFGIVREHGGTMQVVAEAGKGAAFEVSLPVVTPPSLSGE